MESVDILIKNGLIVTINKQMDVIPNGAIAIKDGRIIQIHKTENLEKKFSAKKIFDAESKIVMPGFINAHTHIPMTYFRGLADDLPLQEWLQNYIWPAEAKFVSEEFVYLAALHGEAELVKNGITIQFILVPLKHYNLLQKLLKNIICSYIFIYQKLKRKLKTV